MNTVLGVILLLIPFVAITALIIRTSGWKDAAIVWLVVAAIIACMSGGMSLIYSST